MGIAASSILSYSFLPDTNDFRQYLIEIGVIGHRNLHNHNWPQLLGALEPIVAKQNKYRIEIVLNFRAFDGFDDGLYQPVDVRRNGLNTGDIAMFL